MEELVTLRKFSTYFEAADILELLENNNITYHVEKTEGSGDIVLAGNTPDEEWHVKVKPDDYEIAQKLLAELTEPDIEKLDNDYYLFGFTDKELIEILEKPDEWSPNDYVWAQEILKQRGQEVDKAVLEEWKKKRLDFLAKPEKVTGKYLRTSYLFCFLGGFVGYFMGRHLSSFRKLLPNGQKVLAFDEDSRAKGKQIEMVGLAGFLIYIVLIIMSIFY